MVGRHPVLAGVIGHREDPSRKFLSSSSEFPLADLMPTRLGPWSDYKIGPCCGPYVPATVGVFLG